MLREGLSIILTWQSPSRLTPVHHGDASCLFVFFRMHRTVCFGSFEKQHGVPMKSGCPTQLPQSLMIDELELPCTQSPSGSHAIIRITPLYVLVAVGSGHGDLFNFIALIILPRSGVSAVVFLMLPQPDWADLICRRPDSLRIFRQVSPVRTYPVRAGKASRQSRSYERGSGHLNPDLKIVHCVSKELRPLQHGTDV